MGKRIAVVGATGLVGRAFRKVLEERRLGGVDEYAFFASARSAGAGLDFMGRSYIVKELTASSFKEEHYDIALFSAGGGVSEKFAPIAAENGCVVVDNSSFWRMDKNVPLVVPEVNPDDILWHKGIIANPNCSTIQAVVALKPLDTAYGIKRVVYSTYQAVAGAGQGGVRDLDEGIKGNPPTKFPFPIFGNCLPQIDVFSDGGYTKEELKMIGETRKILHKDGLAVTATCVRVPVFEGHSESVNVEFDKAFDLDELVGILAKSPGVVVQNDVRNAERPYPMAIYAAGTDETYVGRVRRDDSVENGVNLWIVADNVRKGAATNAVQIAELLLKH